ncbi:Guanine nucleotide exchange factor lte1 [Taxawa tesnikishii (nom. ined.)]|nr:Guanine nucleotide exchange factor lte1 [Dothideales sp. JES 119]
MDAASKIHVRLPRNVGDRADASFSHPPEQGSKGRTAQRHGKKSLRNAQDSAEMARRGRSNTTTSADAASRPGRHLEIANVGDNGTIYLRYEPEGAENTTMERTLSMNRSAPTPPASEEGTRQIDSSIYDEIAADPDHPDFVRYAPATGDILAATAARLIVQITAVGFLDYELLSDFFLTYRSFMTSAELVRYLMARMRWAVMHNNDSGRIVRVRTFVAIRHWILNYFIDDFEPDYDLRILFCDLTNQLSLDVQQRPGGGVVTRKCWAS